MNLPEPGLKGNYEGSCVTCLQGTDTVVGLKGEAEWMIAFLVAKLQIPTEEAIIMFSLAHGCDPGSSTTRSSTRGIGRTSSIKSTKTTWKGFSRSC
jgi:hypothetical protein